MEYRYQAEKFSVARRCLMLPHHGGEAQSIVSAFHECSLGLAHFDEGGLDDQAREWVEKLRELMDTTGIADPSCVGTWHIKASNMQAEERYEVSRLVDELASWFVSRFWEGVGSQS